MNSRGLIVSLGFAIALAAGSPPAASLCDTAPPALTGFSFSPSSINTTSASQTVTCNMTLTDDLSGTSDATCSFQSPSFMSTRSCTATVPTSGTPTNGTYSCSITFPRYSEAGTWTAQVSLTDAVGNSQTVFPQFQGFPFALTVTSDSDTIAPALSTFTFNPTAVTVSSTAQAVTCNMAVTDAKSGVDFAQCSFQAPNSSQAQGCVSTTPASGTRNSGTFSCAVTIPHFADAGAWAPSVFLRDLAGNFAIPTVTGTLTVTSSPEDITAPSLTSFSFTPTSVSTGAGPRTVACTMGVSDATSGVNTATCTFSFTDPLNPLISQSQSCVATTPTSGTRNNGTFQCNVTLPRYSTAGAWDADVDLIDLVGNDAPLPQAAQLTVDCSAGDPETTCRFTDHSTLTWDVVSGATRYNLYRGNVSGLTDTNADHKPDGGYGTCQNSRDPNLTDTTFVDTDLPTPTQKGFHYLVGYTTGGVQKGLGTNSFGDSRTVAVPCP